MSDSQKPFELLKHETLFQGYFRVDRYHVQHERFSGGIIGPYTREVFERALDVAGVLLFDPQHDRVALVEQFRAGPLSHNETPWMTEIVLGMVDPHETSEQAARREALEEAGCTVTDLHPIGRYFSSPGGTSEKIHLFVGRCSMPTDGHVGGIAAEHEDIRIHVMDASKAIGLLYNNTLRDAQTLIALQWFAMHHTNLRSRWLVQDVGTPII